jgi:hypothetical protein
LYTLCPIRPKVALFVFWFWFQRAGVLTYPRFAFGIESFFNHLIVTPPPHLTSTSLYHRFETRDLGHDPLPPDRYVGKALASPHELLSTLKAKSASTGTRGEREREQTWWNTIPQLGKYDRHNPP